MRIIDASTARAELAGRILADLGAEVIKVEPPAGAQARSLPPFARGREGDAEASLYWAALALGKRSVVLDIEREGDHESLRQLLADADVFIESFDPGHLAALELAYPQVRELNPALVYVSVTPFGQDGPDAGVPATELTIEAAGGLVGLQGDNDRPPIPIGFPQAAFHAGAQAAADAIIALYAARQSGLGQHLDVSMQAAIVWTLMHATGYPPNTGKNPPNTSEFRADPPLEILPGLALPRYAECADGLTIARFGLGKYGWRTLHSTMRWAESHNAVPEDLCGIDWQNWVEDAVEGALPVEQLQRAIDTMLAFFRTRSKAEILAMAAETKGNHAPVNDVADLRADLQLAARDYWIRVGDRLHPGPFAKLSRTPVRLRSPAPALGPPQAPLTPTREPSPPKAPVPSGSLIGWTSPIRASSAKCSRSSRRFAARN